MDLKVGKYRDRDGDILEIISVKDGKVVFKGNHWTAPSHILQETDVKSLLKSMRDYDAQRFDFKGYTELL